jgi:hypothetical protein
MRAPLFALAAAACFSPTYGTDVTCGPSNECPPQQTCDLVQRLCVPDDSNLIPHAPTLMLLGDRITWSAAVSPIAYTLSRSSTSGGPYTPITTTTATSYLDNQFVDDGTYYYVVTVTDANGTSAPSGELSVDQRHLVCVTSTPRVATFYSQVDGDQSTVRAIMGPDTMMTNPYSIDVDFVHDEVVVSNYATDLITVWPRTADGDAVPRTIVGPDTGLSNAYGVAVDPIHDEIFVVNYPASVTVYNRTDTGDAHWKRNLTGPTTGLTSAYHIALDLANDEIYIANYTGGNYLVFDRTADGDTMWKRNVPAPSPTGIAYDPVHGEVYVADYTTAISVFPRLANGATTASRTISIAAYGVAYDPVREEVLVTRSGGVSIFPRTAMDPAPTPRVIAGPSTGFGSAWYAAICY